MQLPLINENKESTENAACVVVAEPTDVEETLRIAAKSKYNFKVTMLDPLYNKGVGGVRDDYVDYITKILELSALILFYGGFLK